MPEQDLLGPDWENKFVGNVLGGVRLDLDSESMDSSQFTRLENVRYYKNVLAKDTGYKTFADAVFGGSNKPFQHITSAGVANTFLVGAGSLYRLNGNFWHLVPTVAPTTVDVQVNGTGSGSQTIPVASTTNIALNDFVAVELDDGSHWAGTASAIVAGVSFDITPGPPLGSVASVGNEVVTGVKLYTGSFAGPEDFIDGLTVPWDDSFVFTNGIVPVKRYDPATGFVADVPGLPSSGDTLCTSLALFDNSLLLIRTVEGGANFNQRVRWCDRADLTNWTTGDAGSVDLYDSSEKLMKALPIGPYLAIYRENSIVRGVAENSILRRFNWVTVVPEEGIVSPGSVTQVGKNQHVAVGKTKVYKYTGGFEVADIGIPISSILYGVEAEADINQRLKTFLAYVESRNELLLFYADTNTINSNNKCLLWDNDNQVWVGKREFAHEIIGAGPAVASNSFTWNDLVGSWSEQTWTWSSSSVASLLDTLLLCQTDAPAANYGQVYEYDFITPDDAGIAFEGTIETPDFMHPNGLLRIDYMEMRCAGEMFTVEYSTDGGDSWLTYGMAEPGLKLVKVRLYKQFVSRSIRFRFTASAGFKLAWYNLRVTIEAEY